MDMENIQSFDGLEDLVARIAKGEGGLIVDFTGSYCAPCKQLEPVLAKLAEEFREAIAVVTVDIEQYPELAQRYGVRSVPTLIGFHEGQVRAQEVGFSNPRRVREFFTELARLA